MSLSSFRTMDLTRQSASPYLEAIFLTWSRVTWPRVWPFREHYIWNWHTPLGCLLFLHDVVPCPVTLLDQKAQMMPFSSESFLTTTIELFSIIHQPFSHHTHSVKLLNGKWVPHRAEAFMYYFQAYLESQIVYHCQLVSFYLCTYLQDLVLFSSSSQTTLLKQIPHISLDELIRVPTG